VLVTACDMPCPDERLLRHLAAVPAERLAVVPCSPGGLEPLFAVYDRACLPAVEEALASGRLSLARLVERLPHERVSWETVAGLTGGRDPFVNVNTRDDLERLARIL
jgi:molybdopterin-guanine dinucleotide biosynthesis protein A